MRLSLYIHLILPNVNFRLSSVVLKIFRFDSMQAAFSTYVNLMIQIWHYRYHYVILLLSKFYNKLTFFSNSNVVVFPETSGSVKMFIFVELYNALNKAFRSRVTGRFTISLSLFLFVFRSYLHVV